MVGIWGNARFEPTEPAIGTPASSGIGAVPNTHKPSEEHLSPRLPVGKVHVQQEKCRGIRPGPFA